MPDILENLLKNPYIWQGQSHIQQADLECLPSGYSKLDQHLPGGGWPQNSLTEILLDNYGTGELRLLMPALTHLSFPTDDSDSGWIAWIAPPFEPFPPALKEWGMNLSKILIIWPNRFKDILWAVEQALSSGTCAAVLLWPNILDDVASRRLQLAAKKGQSWAIAFRPFNAQSQISAAKLRIRMDVSAEGTHLNIFKICGGRPGIVRDYAG